MLTHKYALVLIFFSFISFEVFANPFTGNRNSPSPVRQSQPSDTITNGQRFLHQQLGEYIKNWSENSTYKEFVLILFFSFLYGMIHAIGPGHRKTVIFSFYIAREAHVLEPLFVAFVLAFSHGTIALLLAFIFKGMAGAMTVNTNDASIYLEGFSFIIIIFLSLFSIIHVIMHHVVKHEHKSQISEKMKMTSLLLSGLYPCPGAILLLVLTFALGIMWTGIVAIFAMSLGMCVPITVSGYLAWAGRKSLFNKLKNKKAAAYIGTILELSGYVFLLFFSLYTAMPFILSLIRKLF